MLLILCVQLFLPSMTGGSDQPVSWVVKLRYEDATASRSMTRAVELAREQGLECVGRVDPFPDVFEFRLSPSVIQDLIRERGTRDMDAQSVENMFDEGLSGHPVVRWASKQVPLKRTKREFSDPAFEKQWHLVGPKHRM